MATFQRPDLNAPIKGLIACTLKLLGQHTAAALNGREIREYYMKFAATHTWQENVDGVHFSCWLLFLSVKCWNCCVILDSDLFFSLILKENGICIILGQDVIYDTPLSMFVSKFKTIAIVIYKHSSRFMSFAINIHTPLLFINVYPCLHGT